MRRTDVVGIFRPDRSGPPGRRVLAEQHDEWTEMRRYIGLDILAKSRLTKIPDPVSQTLLISPTIGKRREWPAPVALQQFAKRTEIKIQVLGRESEMVAKLAHAFSRSISVRPTRSVSSGVIAPASSRRTACLSIS